MSCSSCASARFASSSPSRFFCASIGLTISFLLTSSSARRTAYFAFKSAVLSSADCTAASALALAISCSAYCKSLRFCSRLYFCWLGSNSSTTSPACTSVPGFASSMICSVPPAIGGALTPRDCSVFSAPVVRTTSCRSVSFTMAVGIAESVASTVACRHPTPLPIAAIAAKSAIASKCFFLGIYPLLLQRRIFQGQHRSRLYPFGDQNFVAAFSAHFHIAFFKFRAVLFIHNGAARLSKQRPRRNHNSVGHSRHRNANLRAHSRRQPRIELRQAQLHRKISRYRPSRREIQARRRTDRFHFPLKASVRQRIKLQLRRLSHVQLPSFCLFDPRGNFQSRRIRQFHKSRARPRPVSLLERRRSALRLPVILQRHHSIQRRAQRQRRQTLFVQLHLIRRLIVLLFPAGQIGSRRRPVRLQFRIRLFPFLFRIRQFQFRLFAFNHRQNLLLARVHLRFFRVELRLHHVRQVLLFLQFRRRPRLLNLRIRRRQRRFILRELRFHRRRVELHQRVALFHLRRIRHDRQYLQIPRAVGRRDDHRPLRLHFPFYFQIIHKLLLLRFARRYIRLRTRQPESADHNYADRRRRRDAHRPFVPSRFLAFGRHGFSTTPFASSGLRRTTSPSASPDKTTASRSFVRPTFTSRLSKVLPLLTHAKHFFSSHVTLCRGTTSSLFSPPKSRSSAADKSGKSRGSCPCTANCIANVRTNALNCP